MKILATAAALLLAGAAHAQTPQAQAPAEPAPASPESSLTRDLNSGPPAPATYLAPAPAPVVVSPPTSPPVAAAATPAPAFAPPAVPPARTVTMPPPPIVATPPRATPVPVAPPSRPRTAPITPPTPTPVPRAEPPAGGSDVSPTAPPATGPVSEAAPVVAPPPAPPAVTVLDAAARAALPFTATLPPGFEIVTGRPGPDFRVYTIRRGTQSFVMIYAGPASQFPIYSGQMVEGGGRASILSTEGGIRHAVEHLFQRSAAPNEVHIWTMSLDGADRVMAEEIAQSVDVR